MRQLPRIAIVMLVGALATAGGHGRASGDEAAEARIKAHLTGGDERVWVKTRWVQILSEEAPQCEQGELWIFERNGKGTKKICENGTAREDPLEWAWVGIQDGSPILIVDDKQYVVELRKSSVGLAGEPPTFITILRSLRTTQAQLVEEITLEFRER